MEHLTIHETFGRETLHPLLEWFNPPARWLIDAARSRLVVKPDSETDFWQRTHYGFRADNGHFLGTEVSGDGELAANIVATPAHQYDQAGLMVRSDENCWLKASVEYEIDAPSQLSTVVTNHGYSDWSLQDYAEIGSFSYSLRVRWEGDDFFVEYAPTEGAPWHLMRVAHLFRNTSKPLRSGIYACSPKGFGFQAEFRSLLIKRAGGTSNRG